MRGPYDRSRSRGPARAAPPRGWDHGAHSPQAGDSGRGRDREYDDAARDVPRGSRARSGFYDDDRRGARRGARGGGRAMRDDDDFDPGNGPAWPGDEGWTGGDWAPGEAAGDGFGARWERGQRAARARNGAGSARGRRGGGGTRSGSGGRDGPRRRVGLIVGAVIVLLVLACGGGLAAYSAYTAPGGAASAFCAALVRQDYATAYGTLSSGAQAAISSDQFTTAMQSLDQIQGKVTACGDGVPGGGYQYHFGSSATVVATIARTGGAAPQGALIMLRQAGTWKIDHLDASLFGINLLALVTVEKYCIALQGQDYTGMYALLGTKALAGATAATFAQGSQWHDIVDGQAQSCAVTHLGQGDSDSTASVTLAVSRQKLGAKQGVLTLDMENGAWKVSGVDAHLQGTNVKPLFTATQFCVDISGQKYADMATILDANAAGMYPGQSLANLFNGVDTGRKWTSCLIDPTTYQISGTGASVAAGYVLADYHNVAVGHGSVVIGLVAVAGKWQVDNWAVQS